MGYDSLVATCRRITAYQTEALALAARKDGQQVIRCRLPGNHWHCINA